MHIDFEQAWLDDGDEVLMHHEPIESSLASLIPTVLLLAVLGFALGLDLATERGQIMVVCALTSTAAIYSRTLGFRYTLTRRYLVVFRFDRVQERLPLRALRAIGPGMYWHTLHFGGRRLRILGNGGSLGAFGHALVEGARAEGGFREDLRLRRDGVWFEVETSVQDLLDGQARSGACALCGAPKVGSADVVAYRGFTLIALGWFQTFTLPLSVCATHRAADRRGELLVLGGSALTGLVAAAAYMILAPGGATVQGPIVAGLSAVFVTILIYANVLRRYQGRLGLGVELGRFPGADGRVSLRTRSRGTAERLSKAAKVGDEGAVAVVQPPLAS